LSAGGEWRLWPNGALRAGFYTQADPSDYDVRPAGFSEEDSRLFDLRSTTHSAYTDKNSELFLTLGGGVDVGSAFGIDLSIEDSHLISDYGRTLVKVGVTGRLLNNP
jgi:hypothetical protein